MNIAKLNVRLYRRGRWFYFKHNWFQSVMLIVLQISFSQSFLLVLHTCILTSTKMHVWLVQPGLLVVQLRKRVPVWESSGFLGSFYWWPHADFRITFCALQEPRSVSHWAMLLIGSLSFCLLFCERSAFSFINKGSSESQTGDKL